MKLYGQKQIVGICALVAVCALAAGGVLTSVVMGGSNAFAKVPLQTESPASAPALSESAVPTVAVQYTEPSPSPSLTDDEINNIDIYERANKAVVHITTVTMEYSWFYETSPREGTGSGVIIDKEGHVLTNYHVVKGADKISITLADGSEVEGKVSGADAENDIAVVQFNPKGRSLTVIPFGSSSNLRVGMKVLAIGNPFGFDRTLTTGIVSGLARPLQTEDGYIIRETIQTDAAINPGNSGGPLLNSRGELIGINSAIYSPSGASAGVGFAVPVNTAKRVADELIRFGQVRRGWIDIDPIQLFPSLVSYFHLPVDKGILVNTAGASARQAGLRGGDSTRGVSSGRAVYYPGGDIIVSVNRHRVETYTDYLNALEDTKPGEVVAVKIVRGGQEKTLSLKLVERPSRRGQD